MLNLAGNVIKHVDRNSLTSLKHLEALRLDQNLIEDINGLLTDQTQLQWLNVSNNQLQWFDYACVPKSVKWLYLRGNLIDDLANYYAMTGFNLIRMDVGENKLQRLDSASLQSTLKEILLDNNEISELAPNTFTDLENITLVNLTNNKLEKFPLNALSLNVKHKEGQPQIYLGGNPLVCDCEMEWFQRVTQLAAGSPRKFPQISDWPILKCSLNNRQVQGGGNFTQKLVVPVYKVKPTEFLCSYETHCFALCMCCDFYACDCRMQCSEGCSCYHDQTWSSNIIACDKRGHENVPGFIPMDATSLYLDGNNFSRTSLNNDEFIGRKHLTSLFLNSSSIMEISNQTFNGLSELKILHLELNMLCNLTGGEFSDLVSLQDLYLHGNRLSIISPNTFTPLVKLRVLTLHNNLIVTFPVWDLMSVSGDTLKTITLSSNPWSCECDPVQKMQSSVRKYQGRISVDDFNTLQCHGDDTWTDIGKFNSSCADVLAVSFRSGSSSSAGTILNDLVPIIAVVAASIVIVVSLIILAVALRKPFVGWMRSRGSQRKKDVGNVPFAAAGASSTASSSSSGNAQIGTLGQGPAPVYDVLVHYAANEEEFVHQTLTPGLEDESLQESDHVGDSLLAKRTICYCQQHQYSNSENNASTLEDLIKKCACVVVVASDSYMKSEFRSSNKDYSELKFIVAKCNSLKKSLVAVTTDTISSQALKQSITFRPNNVIQWSPSSPSFWKSLSIFLPKKSSTLRISNAKLLKGFTSTLKPQKVEDDEMWTYLKAGGKTTNLLRRDEDRSKKANRINNTLSADSSLSTQSTTDSLLASLPAKRPSTTLKPTASFHARPTAEESIDTHFTTLQGGRKRPRAPGSTPTARRGTQPRYVGKNLHENPLLGFEVPNQRKSPFNSQSDSDYMSVNDTLVKNNQNEPIYHTLDDEPGQQTTGIFAQGNTMNDDLVYINSALEVVYPTATMLKRQAKLQAQLRANGEDDDDEDNEFNELLGANADDDLTDEDMYENSGGMGYYRPIEGSRNAGSYVPSPAPGSVPRNGVSYPQNYSGSIGGPPANSPNVQLMSKIANRLNTRGGSGDQGRNGSYFV